VYLHEARRLGVRILLPDVNRSVREFAAERVGDAWGLRIGLMQVKGLTGRAIEALLAARKLAPFSSLGELLSRVALSEKEAEALILCGAMDTFGLMRPELIWQLQMLVRAASHQASGLKPQAPALLGQPLPDMGENAPALDDYPPEQKLQHEFEVLGMGASAHPMESYREEDVLRDAVPAAELCRHAGRRVKVAGIPVSVKGTSTRSKGERMKFITLEDASGTCEVVLFPRVYRQWGHVLASGGPYLVEGRVNSNDGAWTVVAERVSRLE
jgi:DNA polymerase III alpha subunit